MYYYNRLIVLKLNGHFFSATSIVNIWFLINPLFIDVVEILLRMIPTTTRVPRLRVVDLLRFERRINSSETGSGVRYFRPKTNVFQISLLKSKQHLLLLGFFLLVNKTINSNLNSGGIRLHTELMIPPHRVYLHAADPTIGNNPSVKLL